MAEGKAKSAAIETEDITSPAGRPRDATTGFLASYPTTTVRPGSVHNQAFHWLGWLFMALNKVRHEVRGYRRPRPFPVSRTRQAVDYDLAVVRKWLAALREYRGPDVSLKGRSVLELGPGADLGTGLLLLNEGARAYHALDVNDLASAAPPDFYDALLQRLEQSAEKPVDVEMLRRQLALTAAGRNEGLDYVCDPCFDLTRFAGRDISVVFSQASFEHFEDPARVIAQLSEVVQPGALLVCEIDLQTHSRWLRDADPLNIYRYSDAVYRAFSFAGSPNRWRPKDYERALREHGWQDVLILPGAVLESDYVARVAPSLAARFRDDDGRMDVLNLVLCATKAGV